MLSLPFVSTMSVFEAVRHCILLALFGGVYYLRAKCEEAHLSNDPVYLTYSRYIENHGLIAFVKSKFRRTILEHKSSEWREESRYESVSADDNA
jgi:hypothetical protein